MNVQSLSAKVGVTDVDVDMAMKLLTKMALACMPVGRESQIKVCSYGRNNLTSKN